MLEMSIALVAVAAMAFYLVNKYLDQRQQELAAKTAINSQAADAVVTAAVTEMHKQFDTRINKTWETIQVTKQELESLKLQLAIKGK
jgi:methionine-rich copper-binding protein CopC